MLEMLLFFGALRMRGSSDPKDVELANLLTAGLMLRQLALVPRNNSVIAEMFL